MKPVVTLSSLLLSGFAAAQWVQSKPFHLVLHSSDRYLDGKNLTACHTGAAIESLCLTNGGGSTFYLNTTEGAQSPLKGYEPSGILVWNLPIKPSPYSESMRFSVEPSSNVALPLFIPGPSSQYVTFNEYGRLAILSYIDDTRSPPRGGLLRSLKNWYICQTYYSGYTYQTLAWVLGGSNAKPQNPSCRKIVLQRQFVDI
ncbi:hypothetical protein XA68_10505 [Ophiocordyceps unilateralis]|uniref:DUF7907 domain-containing protein n=1 Tax=Ophiocordyceps unilateralis TaxID=268505 RepID=A0A2A9PIR0_OPHUN|nr:hypothetical protein XA68_10505 [Ophiocordyceps unilateralis]